MTQCRLGSSASQGNLHSFCGQIGQTIAFSEALTLPDLELMYSIGANMLPVRDYEYVGKLNNYLYNNNLIIIKKKLIVDFRGTIVGQSGSTFVMSNKRSCKIFFSYDPKVYII